jgi:hypothetical protein
MSSNLGQLTDTIAGPLLDLKTVGESLACAEVDEVGRIPVGVSCSTIQCRLIQLTLQRLLGQLPHRRDRRCCCWSGHWPG